MTIWGACHHREGNGEAGCVLVLAGLKAHELIRGAVDVAGSARHASCLIEQQGCRAINKTE